MPLPGRTRTRACGRPPSAAVIGLHAPVALTTTRARDAERRSVDRGRARRRRTDVRRARPDRRRARAIDSTVVCTCTRAPCSMASTRVEHAEARAVDAPLVERDAADEAADEPRLEAREVARVEAAVGLAALEGLVVVVGAEVRVDELEHDRAPCALVAERHQERNAKEQVRRDALDVSGVAARGLGDVRATSRGSATPPWIIPLELPLAPNAEIVALEERDAQPAEREVARDAGAVDAAADDGDVDFVGAAPGPLATGMTAGAGRSDKTPSSGTRSS